VTGRSGAEMEQHDTTLSAWAGGEGGKQAAIPSGRTTSCRSGEFPHLAAKKFA